MFDCNCLIHPFQYDPGTSQRQREMDELLSEAVKIDGREMADLLDYFVQLSRHINYYDNQLNIGDWQPFFKKSMPFTLAAMIRYPVTEIQNNFSIYTSLHKKKAVVPGLQLISRFIYYHFIQRVNNWHLVLHESELPIANVIEKLIKDKLQQPVKDFIAYANAATGEYDIRRFNFHSLYENKVWNIDFPDLYAVDASIAQGNPQQKMNSLYEKFTALFPVLVENIRSLSLEAEKSLDLSLIHTREEFQQKHPPHLGLLFAFLSIFKYLQNDLNQYTRKHLDFFYKDILRFKSGPATPDQAHILIELQQQLKKYMLKKGLLVKAGKDDKKQEMLFGLDDEILVNKTAIAEKRTLFLDNKSTFAQTYVEGVYAAKDATKADGIDKDFPDDLKNFPTLGAKDSKFTDPETGIVKPYEHARLGFILASPVLFLQGGTRKITIKLACKLHDSICNDQGDELMAAGEDCCNPGKVVTDKKPPYPPFYKASKFYDQVNEILASTYYYLSEDILKEALKKGVNKDFIEDLRDEFGLRIKENAVCYCPVEKRRFDNFLIRQTDLVPLTKAELKILEGLVQPIRALNILFSGAEKWIEPSSTVVTMNPTPLANSTIFTIDIVATLLPDKEAVTFYDREKLGEDFNTTQPLVKIELDDRIKLEAKLFNLTTVTPVADPCCVQSANCCVLIPENPEQKKWVSLYHFFRNIDLEESVYHSKITVEVCGLKNFIVQNHESLQDVNAPIYPFSVRPKVNSHFLIGSEEIFLKKWSDLWINVNWKDFPVNGDFDEYYNGYQFEYKDSNGVLQKREVVKKENFMASYSVLMDGAWHEKAGTANCTVDNVNYDPLFPADPAVMNNCFPGLASFKKLFTHQYHFQPGNFQGLPQPPAEKPVYQGIKKWDVDTRCCFLKMTLKCQDFQHDKYSLVLARQMSAEAKLPKLVDGAVYYGINNANEAESINVNDIFKDIKDAFAKTITIRPDLRTLIREIINEIDNTGNYNILIDDDIWQALFNTNRPVLGAPPNALPFFQDSYTDSLLWKNFFQLYKLLQKNNELITNFQAKGVIIPKEPWTPVIGNISLDYVADVDISGMSLIHLYPYPGTYKHVEITQQPSLFPRFCDEGTLFLGLQEFVPGNNLNILFQLAEATADSESEKETVNWHYLDSNTWKPLRHGFEVIEDATENLTTSGIIKFALPQNMTNENSVMPAGQFWIKASIAKNSKAVSETTGIHPQAIRVSFIPDELNDKLRLSKPLVKGSISRLEQADPSVSGIDQPYESFGGALPEDDGHFYIRVSETLRHKGRAIQPWDYERLVLEAFPQIYKAKCISHSFALDAHVYKNDFPYAPGYIVLAVIPDLNKLKAGRSFEPRVPASILEKIEAYFHSRTSPFVRLRARNPRYEKIHFCIKVQLIKGKDEPYYRERLKQDLREFLAPWAVGKFDKLRFGQCVYRSDIIRFMENTGYVDFVTDLRMGHGQEVPSANNVKICPDTARSILVAGEIEVCIEDRECPKTGPYIPCEGKEIIKCENEPELLFDYCKK